MIINFENELGFRTFCIMGGHYIFEWLQVEVESKSEKIIILDKSLGQVSKVPKECNYPFDYK